MAKPRTDRRKATNPEWTKADFEAAVPAADVLPGLVGKQAWAARARGRPPVAVPKRMVSIRLDPELVDAYKAKAAAEGRPYQSVMQDVLAREIAGGKP